MTTKDISERIFHFFFKLIPEAGLGARFNKETISSMIRESVKLSKLSELDIWDDVAMLQDYQVGQSCKILLLALCENLRFGSKESEELLAQLRSQLGYHDLEYEFCIEQRNLVRDDFLYFSGKLKNTPQYSQLKVYLKLVNLSRILEINQQKFDAEIHHITNSGQTEKLVLILGCPQSSSVDCVDAAERILVNLKQELDWKMLENISPNSLIPAVTRWPELRLKIFDVLREQLTGDLLEPEKIYILGDFIVGQVLEDRNQWTKTPTRSQEKKYNSFSGHLLRFLDTLEIPVLKLELLNYISEKIKHS
ncbi:uncharacterized protein LOC111699661 [Eurytemora carolleeae]|uniref:uncharacterized protein LOC111699661 n=1 Tax=Eurytemora carolleeae TaxID=1294199 RepID=UPI000C77AF0D|nr:uncharacterized protein LOC111699661 [Eurytemora carolleeae]|eukprot:XP_023326152.1 uncharacterized protein LOC111699661 [Eurytemora affinis]